MKTQNLPIIFLALFVAMALFLGACQPPSINQASTLVPMTQTQAAIDGNFTPVPTSTLAPTIEPPTEVQFSFDGKKIRIWWWEGNINQNQPEGWLMSYDGGKAFYHSNAVDPAGGCKEIKGSTWWLFDQQSTLYVGKNVLVDSAHGVTITTCP